MKKLLTSVLASWLFTMLCGCTADLKSYSGENWVRFTDNIEDVYSFAYYSKAKTTDTVKVIVMTVGDVVDHPRKVRIEQVRQAWKYKYADDDANKIIDSTYTDMEYPAEPGTHFEILNATNNEVVVPEKENRVVLKILVKRDDKDLQKHARQLHLKLLPTADFGVASPTFELKKILISDKLEKPSKWSTKNYFCNLYLGEWSEVKHRFMINVTGRKWDDEFINYYIRESNDRPLRDFYLQKIKKALEEYNANPKNNPPLKDENGNIVVFP